MTDFFSPPNYAVQLSSNFFIVNPLLIAVATYAEIIRTPTFQTSFCVSETEFDTAFCTV